MKELIAIIVLAVVAKDIYDKSTEKEAAGSGESSENKGRLPQSRDYPARGYQGA